VHDQQRGFTLIEIIVVIALISIVLTMVTVSIGDPQVKRMQEASERFIALIQLTKEQAIFNSQEYAVSIWDSGYSFYTLDKAGWILVTGDKLFRARDLSEGITHKLYLDNIKVILPGEDNKKPQIFITSDGEISPFKLDITDSESWSYKLTFNELGDSDLVLTEEF